MKFYNIVVQFLQVNTIAFSQRMDAGIIQNVKNSYRMHLMHLILRKIETCEKVKSDFIALLLWEFWNSFGGR